MFILDRYKLRPTTLKYYIHHEDEINLIVLTQFGIAPNLLLYI
jgi:hypothetical protein